MSASRVRATSERFFSICIIQGAATTSQTPQARYTAGCNGKEEVATGACKDADNSAIDLINGPPGRHPPSCARCAAWLRQRPGGSLWPPGRETFARLRPA